MATQRPLRDWDEGDPLSASHLQEAIDMLRPLSSIVGGGITEVTQFPEGTAIYTPEQTPGPPGVIWVRVLGNETPTGYYYGRLLRTANQTIDLASAPAPTTWLEDTGEDVVIQNHGPLEDGHVLTDTTDGVVTQSDFQATWNGTTNEDPPRRVAIILGLNPYACSTTPPP